MKTTMKALNLYGVNDLRYEEVSMPIRKTGEVLLRIRACGICGSDIPRIFTKGTYHFPTIPGHEFSGEIIEADNPVLVGKRAAVFPLLPCFKCKACKEGRYAQCEKYNYYGSRCDGGFSEYVAVKEWNLLFFDGDVSYEEAAMCEPATVALHSIKQSGLKKGDSITIFGAGPIGILLGLWSKKFGAKDVVLCDIDPKKNDFAHQLGFKHAINSAQIDPIDYVHQITGGQGTDVSIEGAGVAQTLEQAIKSVRSFGTVVCMGNPTKEMTLTQNGYWEILRRELVVKGTWNSIYNSTDSEWQQTLKAISTRELDMRNLVSHRFNLSDYKQAFSLLLERKHFSNKVMFTND